MSLDTRMGISVGCTVRGDGEPVVLLHGSMSSRFQWGHLIRRLSPGFKSIAVDLYGYGETSFPLNPAAFSLGSEVKLIASIVRKAVAEGERFHVVGHGYGGAVALQLAHVFDGRLSSLTLIEPAAFSLIPRHEFIYSEVVQMLDALELASLDDPFIAARIFVDYWNGENAYGALPERVQRTLAVRIGKARLDMQAALRSDMTLSDCRDLKVPTFLLSARNSPNSTKRIADLLSVVLPNHTRCDLKAGHMAPITHADEVSQHIAAFLLAAKTPDAQGSENVRRLLCR